MKRHVHYRIFLVRLMAKLRSAGYTDRTWLKDIEEFLAHRKIVCGDLTAGMSYGPTESDCIDPKLKNF